MNDEFIITQEQIDKINNLLYYIEEYIDYDNIGLKEAFNEVNGMKFKSFLQKE